MIPEPKLNRALIYKMIKFTKSWKARTLIKRNHIVLNVQRQIKLYSARTQRYPACFIVTSVFQSFCFPLGPTCGTVIFHHTPLCLNKADDMMAVIYTPRPYSHSENRSAAVNTDARCWPEGGYLTANGKSSTVPDSTEVRCCAAQVVFVFVMNKIIRIVKEDG